MFIRYIYMIFSVSAKFLDCKLPIFHVFKFSPRMSRIYDGVFRFWAMFEYTDLKVIAAGFGHPVDLENRFKPIALLFMQFSGPIFWTKSLVLVTKGPSMPF